MTDKHSGKLTESSALPELWSRLKDRLSPDTLTSRYQVSDDGTGEPDAVKELLDGHDIALNRPVAIKRLDKASQRIPEKLESFVGEARLTGNLQHPNIIPVHDLISTEDGSLLFTLRHVDGNTLDTILKKDDTDLSLNETMNIFLKICDAIAYAHNNLIFHKALSLKSIVIGHFGEVFVLNWGDAEKEEQHAEELRYNEIKSLGTILGSMVDKAVSNGEELPISLEAVIRRAGRPMRSNYTSVESLREDIDRFQAGLPTVAEEASPIRHLVLLSKRHKLEAVALVMAVGIAVLMTLWFIAGIKQAKERASLAATSAEASQASAERSTKKELEHLEDLRTLTPMLMSQMNIDMANGRPKEALAGAVIALELMDDKPDPLLLEKHGDILQVLLRFEESIESYRRIPLTPENTDRIKGKTALSDRLKSRMGPDAFKDNLYMGLYRELDADNRIHEANYILNSFQNRQVKALESLGAQPVNEDNRNLLHLTINQAVEMYAVLQSGNLRVNWVCSSDSAPKLEGLESLPLTDLKCTTPGRLKTLDPLKSKPLLSLELPETDLTDLSPLSQLPLKRLSIRSSQVTSLEPLSSLKLDTFIFRDSPYDSLQPLAGQPLKLLDISGSKVRDLSPLKSRDLNNLSVADTPVVSLAGINLSKLKTLDISRTAIVDLKPLSNGRLTKLRAIKTPINDLSPLATTPVEVLVLNESNIRSLEPLEGLRITDLSIARTKVTSLEPIAMTETLQYLDISGLAIKKLPPNNWVRLKSLTARVAQLTDLGAVQGLSLRTVNLSETEVIDIRPVVNPILFDLNLQSTRVSDLTPLAGSNLKHLNIAGTPITSLRPLADVSLNSLDVSNTSINSLEGIERLPLATLDISNTRVSDLTPIKDLPLKAIRLTPESITTGMDVLRSMPTLKTINDLPKEAALQSAPFLKGMP